MATKKALTANVWESLDDRQKEYMKAIFMEDHLTERYEKGAWSRGEVSRPASEWRWMLYGETYYEPSSLKERLSNAGLPEDEALKTLQPLEEKNLIKLRRLDFEETDLSLQVYLDRIGNEDFDFEIYLERTGRKVVREFMGFEGESKLPAGKLKDYQWEALAACYAAGIWGFAGIGRYDCSFGGFSHSAWERLKKKNRTGSLVQEYQYSFLREWTPPPRWDRGKMGWADSVPKRIWAQETRIAVTLFGEQFYRENWQAYRELYPNIEAIAPRPAVESPPNPIPDAELGYWIRRCRRGRSFVEISKVLNDEFCVYLEGHFIQSVENGYLPNQLNEYILIPGPPGLSDESVAGELVLRILRRWVLSGR